MLPDCLNATCLSTRYHLERPGAIRLAVHENFYDVATGVRFTRGVNGERNARAQIDLAA